MKKAAFIDRDGTILSNDHHLISLDQYDPVPKSFEGIRVLVEKGFYPVVITNQSGVARGHYGENFVEEVRDLLGKELRDAGVGDFAHYYCPHHPEVGEFPYKMDCNCRKPLPGMLLKAAKDHGIDLADSIVIGDAETDYRLAMNNGIDFYLVATGHGEKTREMAEKERNKNYKGFFPTLYDAALAV